MALIDFDGMFEKKLAVYMKQNAGKYTEEEWEDLIPKLYKKFGATYVKSAGNTPKAYYANMDDKTLVATLEAHIKEKVPVSDFLCRELEKRDQGALVPLILSGKRELAELALGLVSESEKVAEACFILLEGDADAELKELAIEKLKECADGAKERALACYAREIERERMLEILCRCKEKDDRVYEILMKEFKTAEGELSDRANYLATYGDERALPLLLEYLDREEINFLEYRELKYAVEALGGEYTRERDFSQDPLYLELDVKTQLAAEIDKN